MTSTSFEHVNFFSKEVTSATARDRSNGSAETTLPSTVSSPLSLSSLILYRYSAASSSLFLSYTVSKSISQTFLIPRVFAKKKNWLRSALRKSETGRGESCSWKNDFGQRRKQMPCWSLPAREALWCADFWLMKTLRT